MLLRASHEASPSDVRRGAPRRVRAVAAPPAMRDAPGARFAHNGMVHIDDGLIARYASFVDTPPSSPLPPSLLPSSLPSPAPLAAPTTITTTLTLSSAPKSSPAPPTPRAPFEPRHQNSSPAQRPHLAPVDACQGRPLARPTPFRQTTTPVLSRPTLLPSPPASPRTINARPVAADVRAVYHGPTKHIGASVAGTPHHVTHGDEIILQCVVALIVARTINVWLRARSQ